VLFSVTSKKLGLICDVGEMAPSVVLGDATRIKQIIINLVTNAIKFSDKGEIVVSVTYKDMGNNQTELQFSIKDEGIGIPAEAQKKLFTPFTQADISTTRKYVRL
jgi:signal transduction histidine kinase